MLHKPKPKFGWDGLVPIQPQVTDWGVGARVRYINRPSKYSNWYYHMEGVIVGDKEGMHHSSWKSGGYTFWPVLWDDAACRVPSPTSSLNYRPDGSIPITQDFLELVK